MLHFVAIVAFLGSLKTASKTDSKITSKCRPLRPPCLHMVSQGCPAVSKMSPKIHPKIMKNAIVGFSTFRMSPELTKNTQTYVKCQNTPKSQKTWLRPSWKKSRQWRPSQDRIAGVFTECRRKFTGKLYKNVRKNWR